MKLDCKNLDCPLPLVKTKEALEGLEVGQRLEVELNSEVSFKNVSKFLKELGVEFSHSLSGEIYTVSLTKNGEFSIDAEMISCKTKSKVIYLKDDKTGSEPVGRGLLAKILSSFLSIEDKPLGIICVNQAVKMTTDRGHESFQILKLLEEQGVRILSCGSCLEAFSLVDKLSVGEIGNAYEIAKILLEYDVVSL